MFGHKNEEWKTPVGELFVHSHVYESQDGAEHEGLEEVTTRSAFNFSKKLGRLRQKHAPESQAIIPTGVDEIGEFIADSFGKLREASMQQSDFMSGDVFVVGKNGSLRRINEDGSQQQIIEPSRV